MSLTKEVHLGEVTEYTLPGRGKLQTQVKFNVLSTTYGYD